MGTAYSSPFAPVRFLSACSTALRAARNSSFRHHGISGQGPLLLSIASPVHRGAPSPCQLCPQVLPICYGNSFASRASRHDAAGGALSIRALSHSVGKTGTGPGLVPNGFVARRPTGLTPCKTLKISDKAGSARVEAKNPSFLSVYHERVFGQGAFPALAFGLECNF